VFAGTELAPADTNPSHPDRQWRRPDRCGMKTALIVRAVLGALSLAVIFARPRWQLRCDAGVPLGPRVGDAISIEGRPFPSCRERRNETVTFNHGVEGSSPSALTKKSPFYKANLKRPKCFLVTSQPEIGISQQLVSSSKNGC
jgi:hypothetical protein